MKKSKRIKIILIIVPLIIMLVLVKLIFFGSQFFYVGTIEATKVDLSSRVSSVISKIYVKEGDKISKDQTLLDMTCEDVRINASQIEKDFQRAASLFSQGSMPKENYEHLRVKNEDSKLKLAWCEIKTPINGTILTKYREEGELVQYGTKLFTVANLEDIWTNIYVPQPLIAKLSLGMELNGYLPELEMKELKGKIIKISEEAEFTPKNVQTREERTRLVFAIKVEFDNKDNILKPGMNIEIKLPE